MLTVTSHKYVAQLRMCGIYFFIKLRSEKTFSWTYADPKILKNCNAKSVIAGYTAFGTYFQKSAKSSEEFCTFKNNLLAKRYFNVS